MLGFRGASRYYNKRYKEGFALECKALKKAREVIGLGNIVAMVPFCRTLEEADGSCLEDDGRVWPEERGKRSQGVCDGGDPLKHPSCEGVRAAV